MGFIRYKTYKRRFLHFKEICSGVKKCQQHVQNTCKYMLWVGWMYWEVGGGKGHVWESLPPSCTHISTMVWFEGVKVSEKWRCEGTSSPAYTAWVVPMPQSTYTLTVEKCGSGGRVLYAKAVLKTSCLWQICGCVSFERKNRKKESVLTI